MKRRSGFYGIPPPPRMIMSLSGDKLRVLKGSWHLKCSSISDGKELILWWESSISSIDTSASISFVSFNYELSYFRILYNILQNVLVYFCIFGSYSSLDEVWVFTHGILQKVNWCKDNTLWTKIKNASSLLHCTVLKSKCLYLVRNNKCPYMKERFYIDMSFAYGLDISYMFSLNHSA